MQKNVQLMGEQELDINYFKIRAYLFQKAYYGNHNIFSTSLPAPTFLGWQLLGLTDEETEAESIWEGVGSSGQEVEYKE